MFSVKGAKILLFDVRENYRFYCQRFNFTVSNINPSTPNTECTILVFFITQKQKVMHNLEGRFDILVTEICFVNAYVNVLYLQMI